MGKNEGKKKWKLKNSGAVFALCLTAVAAGSALFAAGQVKRAKQEQIEMEKSIADAKQAAEEAEKDGLQLDAAKTLGEMSKKLETEAAASRDITAELEHVGNDTTLKNEADLSENAAADPAEGLTKREKPDTDGTLQGQAGAGTEERQMAEQAGVNEDAVNMDAFEETNELSWPVVGSVVLDYSMDGSVYFPTLQQYKYNPALIIGSDEGTQVLAAADGVVEQIGKEDEIGTTVRMNLGNGYKLTYGQMENLQVAEGDAVSEGDLIGYVSKPTKYYCVEGSNLYFGMTKDDVPVDPVLYMK